MSNQNFDTPWEQPAIQSILNIFDGSVTNVQPLNEVKVNIGGNDDGDEIQR